MTQLFRRAVCLILSTAFVLSTFTAAGATTCASKISAASTVMKMACCMEHPTPGVQVPCRCSVKSAPATPAQNFTGASHVQHSPQTAAVEEKQPFIGFQKEPLNSQWLALDTRLRAPPVPLYILNCAFLK